MPFLFKQLMAMNITQEKKDDLNAVLKIDIEKSDYQPLYEKALKDYRQRINLPGFRQGHVPMGIVKKRFGKSLLAEEINQLLNDTLRNYIDEQKLDVLGSPIPSESSEDAGNWDDPGDFHFYYDLALAPQFEVNIDGKTKFDFHRVEVGDQMIDEQIESLTRRHGKLNDIEEAGDSDLLLGAFVELDGDDNIVEGGLMNTSSISIEYVKDEATQNQLVGLKPGDFVVVDPRKVSSGPEDMAKMLGIEKGQVDQYPHNFRFNVKEVKRMQPAALDTELFGKLFGKDEVKTVDEFRERLKADMEKMFEADSERLFKREVMKALEQKLKLQLPDGFLKRWIKISNEKPLSEEQLEKEYPEYARGLVWQLIQNQLIKELEVKVEANEVLDYTKSMVANNFRQYGMPVPEDKELDDYAKNALKNQDEMRKVYEQLYDIRLMEKIREVAKIKEVSMPYDDFVAFAQQG